MISFYKVSSQKETTMKHLTIALIMTLLTSFSALAAGKSRCPLAAKGTLATNDGSYTRLDMSRSKSALATVNANTASEKSQK
jgi:hypothetical protein